MPGKPNFDSAVALEGDTVRVIGQTGSEGDAAAIAADVADIVGIHVVLAQDAQITRGVVEELGLGWQVTLPAAGFKAGPAVAFGIELRRLNSTMISWSEPVEIR
jgi:molybdate-binding protein